MYNKIRERVCNVCMNMYVLFTASSKSSIWQTPVSVNFSEQINRNTILVSCHLASHPNQPKYLYSYLFCTNVVYHFTFSTFDH